MLTVSIVLIVVSILLVIYSVYALTHTRTVNQAADEENNKLLERKTKLQNQINIQQTIIDNNKNQIQSLQENIQTIEKSQEELSRKAFENYCEILENNYKEKEEEYDQYEDSLSTAYSNLQLKLLREADEIKAELDKIRATRAAAIQAQIKEKEIKEKLSFYCLKISDNELKDISVLESIKPKLNNPRVLSMLIWQTFWRKPMTDLCNNVIGTSDKSGIYKITNQITDECYIGQAVNLATRWKDHAKCGLGIDAPPANKLYKAMQEYGIWNFSWEVLEECPKDQLDEKEKNYINLYQAKDYGYNSTHGNK